MKMIPKASFNSPIPNPLNILPPEHKKLFQFIFDEGFYLVLIGGAVRKYLLNLTTPPVVNSMELPLNIGTDLDFEIP